MNVLVLIYYFISTVSAFTFIKPASNLQAEYQKQAVFTWNFLLESDETIKTISIDHNRKTGGTFVIAYYDTKVNWNTLQGANWFQDNGEIDVRNSSVELKFPIVDVKTYNGDTFTCEITSSKTSAKASTQLMIVYKPIIRTSTQTTETIKEGSSLTLSCNADGQPAPDISWYHNSNFISTKSETNNHKFSDIKRNQSGNYTCIARNIAGSVSIFVKVVVQYEPKIDKSKSTLEVGSYVGNLNAVYLSCFADGEPKPTYTWQSPAGHIVGDHGKGNYSIWKPNFSEFGVYICEAENSVGSDRIDVKLKEIGYPDSFNITITDIKSTSAYVAYKSPAANRLGNSFLKKLVLTYVDETGAITTKQLDPNATRYKIEDLKPYMKYIVNITIHNEFFQSEGQKKRFQTQEDIPGKPIIESVDPISQHEVKVTWSPPLQQNGILTKYSLKFYQTNVVKFDDAVSEDITDVTTLSKVFKSLKPFTSYHTSVRASTIKGDGPWSPISICTTDPEPQNAPVNVTVIAESSTKIILQWKPPHHVLPGEITQYNIVINCTSNEDSRIAHNDFPVTSDGQINRPVTFNRMIPFAACVTMVRLGSGDKPVWGSFSVPYAFSVPEGVPDEVNNLKILEYTSHDIKLRWDRPRIINGVLTKFMVKYTNSSGTYSDTITTQLYKDTFEHTIVNLSPNNKYKIEVLAYSRVGSSPSVSETLSTGKFVGEDTSGGSNMTAILIGIFSVVGILVIAAIILIYVRRKQMLKRSNDGLSAGFVKLQPSDTSPIHIVDGSTAKKSVSMNSLPPPVGFLPPDYVKDTSCTFKPIRPISITSLKDFVAKSHANRDKGFIDEFRGIKTEGDFTFDVSVRPENKCKNRYANILAYDHSRVVLNTVENLDGSDYVNANYVDEKGTSQDVGVKNQGYNKKAKFISTQGPVVAAFNDFWRMVWEQNATTIVMVTNLVERSRIAGMANLTNTDTLPRPLKNLDAFHRKRMAPDDVDVKIQIKCQKYWPSDDDKVQIQGNIRIYPIEEMELADYVVRRFKVTLMKDEEELSSRQVTQYQFLSWPDHGVPQFATPLLQFVKRIRMIPNDKGPVIVHCSAGVGRSGTFITLDAMLDQIDNEAAVDVLGFVTHMRTQRNLMVQTEGQYVFLFNALLESVLCGETEVNTSDLPARIKHLSSLNPGTTQTYMQEEFERLDINMEDTTKYMSAVLPVNKSKNRFPEILPYELTRVKLWPYPNQEGSDYINASFVDGYQQREAYILTQAPLENTINDFWRMLWEYEIFSVVMVSSANERDKNHCYPYWPVNNEATMFGLLSVQISVEEERNGFIKREFRVTNTKWNRRSGQKHVQGQQNNGEVTSRWVLFERHFTDFEQNGESRVVSHFMYFDWSPDEAPDSTSIIEMIGQLQKAQQQTGNSIIVLHCSNGSGRCGALVALMYCLERLKLEGVVDVFQTVRSMRTQRPLLVETLEQYQFIYKAVRNFLDCFSDYANFK